MVGQNKSSAFLGTDTVYSLAGITGLWQPSVHSDVDTIATEARKEDRRRKQEREQERLEEARWKGQERMMFIVQRGKGTCRQGPGLKIEVMNVGTYAVAMRQCK